MSRRILIVLSLLLTISTGIGRAQYYQIGADPSSTRWNQIKSDNYDLIYPVEIDSLAREFLFAFEKTRLMDHEGLHIESVRVPLILHPYTMLSNATVVWAPKRAELYTTPPFNALYAKDWEMSLATHEGRHLGQMVHYTKGLYKVLGYLAGEQSIAIGVGFYPSKVLLEGDATQNETDLSNTGRGRDPEFLKMFRASFVDGDIRSYDNWRYGSYRYNTPNKYAFGYMISSTMRDNSGNYYVTGDIMAEQVKSWWRFFSVSHRSYNRASGLTARKNWRLAVAERSKEWKDEYEMRKPYSTYDYLLEKPERLYAEFENVMPLGDEGDVFATMQGMQYERHIVRIDSTGKHWYRRPFATSTSSLTKDSDESFIFSEVVPDPRWELRNWSVIKRYDASTNQMYTLTHKTRYANPTVSASGDSIIAVEYKVEGGSDVVFLDRDGKFLGSVQAPGHSQLLNAADFRGKLYATAISTEGLGLYRYQDGQWECLIEDQPKMIRDLRAVGDEALCFTSDLNGITNVYFYDPDTGVLKQQTNARFSATMPTVENGNIYYSDYDKMGYTPAMVPRDSLLPKEASFKEPFLIALADRNSKQALEHIHMPTTEEDEALRNHIDSLESKRYSKLGHTVHIHSWAPLYANISRIMDLSYEQLYQLASPGVTLISQNNLGTAVTTLGYGWHKDSWGDVSTILHPKEDWTGFHSLHLNFNYSGLYPVFEIAADYNDRYQSVTRLNDFGTSHASINSYLTDKSSIDFSAMVYLPLNFSSGGWSRGLVPQLKYVASNDLLVKDNTQFFNQALFGSVRYYTMLPKSKSRLTPRWGISVTASGQSVLLPGDLCCLTTSISAYGYVPGLFKNHGIKLSYSWQQQDTKYSYTNNIASLPRGYTSIDKSQPLINYQKATIDYAIPIYLGDSGWPWLCYLQLLQVIPFADYAFDKSHLVLDDQRRIIGSEFKQFYSYGTAVLVNAHWFRIGTELKLGVRYSHLADGANRFQFIMNAGL